MRTADVLAQARVINSRTNVARGIQGTMTEAQELVRLAAGEQSAFYKALNQIERRSNDEWLSGQVHSVFSGFVRHLESGLLGGASLERHARADVGADLMEQAQLLLDSEGVHPAAAAVVVGAVLEEFLRNWVEDAGLSLSSRAPSIDSYSAALRTAELISKQDVKDIASWGGIRNSAAHGKWDEVKDPSRIRVMLDGVSLFLRKNAT
jgi:hypothetical protein